MRKGFSVACGRPKLIMKRDSGFSMVELLMVVLIMGIVIAFAIPQASTAIRDYRLHSDAGVIAGQLNVGRMRAASQYAPYRVVINIAAGTYWMEKLCGLTTSTADPNCVTTGVPAAYQPRTVPSAQIEGGTQYLGTNDTYSSCRPSGVTAYPGSITADPNPCPDPLYIYFNTRGVPVDYTGQPLGNGGAVLYLTNTNGMTDAVTVSIGGNVNQNQWNKTSSTWRTR
jgi:prepilin-type N-terminal cleavage/methylation domain-containing protein